MLFTITEEIYKRGVRAQCGNCPVAIAIKESIPNLAKCEVDFDNILLGFWEGKTIKEKFIKTPWDVSDFVLKFDGAVEIMLPYYFELSI
jgi:hypothetical protein